MQTGLSGGVIDKQNSEPLPDLDDPREYLRVVIEFGQGCNCHYLSNCTEAEYLFGLQLMHVGQTLWDAREGICYHVI